MNYIVWLLSILVTCGSSASIFVESFVPTFPAAISTCRGPRRYAQTSVSRIQTNNNLQESPPSLWQRPRCILKRSQNAARTMGLSVSSQEEEEKGSLVGAALLFAGTAIGAGMLALPAETAPAGFVPSATSLLLCWAFTYVTSLVTLEATWSVTQDDSVANKSDVSVGFLSVSRKALGPTGELVTALLFWFLLSAIVVAYTSEGGQLLTEGVHKLTSGSLDLSPIIGSTCFMAFFGSFAIFGTERVDLVNRILVAGFLVAFLGLMGVGLPNIQATTLLKGAQHWNAVYPGATSVGILAFGAQNVVPTLLQYLGGNAERTRRAILVGSLLPLAMYLIWEAVFFGTIPLDLVGNDGNMDVLKALGDSGGPFVQDLVEIFSACAVGSSMAGASVSLVDFFQDALSSSSSIKPPATTGLGNRLLAAFFALGPPLGLACAFPQAFLGALENAGLIGAVSLYGAIPAIAVLRLRSQNTNDENDNILTKSENSTTLMPGRLSGGSLPLYTIVVLSATLVLPEFGRLANNAFFSFPSY